MHVAPHNRRLHMDTITAPNGEPLHLVSASNEQPKVVTVWLDDHDTVVCITIEGNVKYIDPNWSQFAQWFIDE